MPSAAKPDTVLTTLMSAVHGRERREERGIDKTDLQRARKYGMRERARQGRYKYTYGGVVFIYDQKTNTEVTSWISSDDSSIDSDAARSGTRVMQPIMLKKEEISFSLIEKRQTIRESLLRNKKKWTSHSVLVVDMSGSMRKDDVNGSRCRSDGVWMSLARDYVKIPLDNGIRTGTDLISVIVMREEAEILLACEPTDWCLYNKFLDLREWEHLKPSGHGNYMPALAMAQKMLNLNTKGSCALALLFFSDGKPSDIQHDHVGAMGELASKFGRRLTIACIGMASEADKESFTTLRDMAYEADSYGSQASFGSASLNVDSLSKIISSLASSLTETKTEMTDQKSGKSMTVRMDIRRERKGTPDDLILTGDWNVYGQHRFGRSWIWSYQHDDFSELFDFRCLTCNEDARVGPDTIYLKSQAIMCEGCRSACFCSNECYAKGYTGHVLGDITNVDSCALKREAGIEKRIVTVPVPSYAIAVRKEIFGEGAERIVSKLRYLDKNHRFKGPKLVAKDTRHVLNKSQYREQLIFHKTFMRTQAIASEIAKKFNRDIDALESMFDNSSWSQIVRCLPRIKFLEPCVTELWNDEGEAEYYLIEPFLEGRYTKFNSNNGFVQSNQDKDESKPAEETTSDFSGHDLIDLLSKKNISSLGLGMIEECDESDEDNSSAHESFDLKDEYFPQAFSHYTYVKSKKRMMVVDLQGVLDKKLNGCKSYNLTDPVIHTRTKKCNTQVYNFGRTNRGDKGIKAFMKSHICSDACKLLGLGLGPTNYALDEA